MHREADDLFKIKDLSKLKSPLPSHLYRSSNIHHANGNGSNSSLNGNTAILNPSNTSKSLINNSGSSPSYQSFLSTNNSALFIKNKSSLISSNSNPPSFISPLRASPVLHINKSSLPINNKHFEENINIINSLNSSSSTNPISHSPFNSFINNGDSRRSIEITFENYSNHLNLDSNINSNQNSYEKNDNSNNLNPILSENIHHSNEIIKIATPLIEIKENLNNSNFNSDSPFNSIERSSAIIAESCNFNIPPPPSPLQSHSPLKQITKIKEIENIDLNIKDFIKSKKKDLNPIPSTVNIENGNGNDHDSNNLNGNGNDSNNLNGNNVKNIETTIKINDAHKDKEMEMKSNSNIESNMKITNSIGMGIGGSTSTVALSNWSFSLIPNNPKFTGYDKEFLPNWIVLVGKRQDLVELWHSSIVTERLGSTFVLTGSGRIYEIIPPLDELGMMDSGFSMEFCKKFQNEFPSNWKDLLISEIQKIFLSKDKNSSFSSNHSKSLSNPPNNANKPVTPKKSSTSTSTSITLQSQSQSELKSQIQNSNQNQPSINSIKETISESLSMTRERRKRLGKCPPSTPPHLPINQSKNNSNGIIVTDSNIDSNSNSNSFINPSDINIVKNHNENIESIKLDSNIEKTCNSNTLPPIAIPLSIPIKEEKRGKRQGTRSFGKISSTTLFNQSNNKKDYKKEKINQKENYTCNNNMDMEIENDLRNEIVDTLQDSTVNNDEKSLSLSSLPIKETLKKSPLMEKRNGKSINITNNNINFNENQDKDKIDYREKDLILSNIQNENKIENKININENKIEIELNRQNENVKIENNENEINIKGEKEIKLTRRKRRHASLLLKEQNNDNLNCSSQKEEKLEYFSLNEIKSKSNNEIKSNLNSFCLMETIANDSNNHEINENEKNNQSGNNKKHSKRRISEPPLNSKIVHLETIERREEREGKENISKCNENDNNRENSHVRNIPPFTRSNRQASVIKRLWGNVVEFI